MNIDQKNRQLQYIKGHLKWLLILSLVLGIFIVATIIYSYKRFYNAQQFHIKTHKRLQTLEANHARN